MTKRTCRDCGEEFTPTHGRNVYCPQHRGKRANRLREYREVECVQCGKTFRSARSTGKLCSDGCRSEWYRSVGYGPRKTVCRLPFDHPVRVLIRGDAARFQQRSRRRIAWESGDWTTFLAELQLDTVETGGCWVWQRQRTKDGYPILNIGKHKHQVHRMVVEAKHGKPLGSQAAHHVCANTLCVNPDHLQPVTARENTAEMLARSYMERRIAALEVALASHNPNHPLLMQIGVARSPRSGGGTAPQAV